MPYIWHPNITASRDPKRKWYVTYEEWSEKVFPTFCFGLAYILPREAIVKLLHALQKQKFLWLDDIFVTGVLARLTTVSRVNIDTQYNYNPMKSVQIWRDSCTFALIRKCNFEYFFLIANSHLFMPKMTTGERQSQIKRL
ncbi:hypothetical protein Aduo_004553 [Ancylostoma duodenale]